MSIGIAALLLLLAACNKEELGTDAQSAPVVITATSSWLNDDGTRAVKESFAAGDEITLTYSSTNYVYKLDKVNGWVPVGTALVLPIATTPSTATATGKDGDYTLTASETDFYATATANGEKTWGISLEFAYSDAGAVDLTLLKEDLTELKSITAVTITRGSDITVSIATADDLKGIIVPAGAITEVSATVGTDTYSATLTAGNVVEAGKRHALTVVVKPVTP